MGYENLYYRPLTVIFSAFSIPLIDSILWFINKTRLTWRPNIRLNICTWCKFIFDSIRVKHSYSIKIKSLINEWWLFRRDHFWKHQKTLNLYLPKHYPQLKLALTFPKMVNVKNVIEEGYIIRKLETYYSIIFCQALSFSSSFLG